ncbi:putative membrane protein [[Clostridium] cellulosi]|uniref:Putative membrane protein n=1 Tax=[Clostridium] cellulosi TaxID=29343 RepID=A0A078KR14_9FIRM|nr:MAG: DUF2142 domain-containing protein [[Clostridium] cellulosi]CDZ24838.1 putative membrane protein [[Clostridium] cellulosi]
MAKGNGTIGKTNRFPVETAGIFFAAILAAAFIVASLISIFSGINAHPDEQETYKAIQYYYTHWNIADIRDPLVYFSIYGTTRMAELNPYYYIAGKVGALFSWVLNYQTEFRIFNLLLLAFIIGLAACRNKKARILLPMLMLTPQAWYLYSYGTSDAWDLFLSILILYQIVNPDSMLNKYLGTSISKKSVLFGLLASLLFALQLMSKPNYFVTLVMAFIILLIRLVSDDKINKKEFFIKCLALLLCTFAIFGIRKGVDLAQYGFNKAQIVQELKEEKADKAFKPSTPVNEKWSTMQLHDRNVSLKTILTEKQFFQKSFVSFIGSYGYLQYMGPAAYINLMLFLYLALYAIIFYYCVKSRNRRVIIEFIAMNAILLLSVGLSVYNSWFVDFQPQGRYLLPMLIPFAYCFTLDKRILKNTAFNAIILITGLMSLYSFIFIGSVNLIK